MTTKVEEIIEQLKSLTLLEAADLVKQIEAAKDKRKNELGL
jgi:ribosomal protein L7/L12